jgi:hypothetical protein
MAALSLSSVSAQRSPAAEFDALRQKYVGNDDTDAFLAEPAIRGELMRLLGPNLAHLRQNLDVRGSVDFVSGALSLPGNAVRGGGLEEAIVCVSAGIQVHAAIFSKNAFAIYTRATNYDGLPICIKDWITQVKSGHWDRLKQPVDVTLVKGK